MRNISMGLLKEARSNLAERSGRSDHSALEVEMEALRIRTSARRAERLAAAEEERRELTALYERHLEDDHRECSLLRKRLQVRIRSLAADHLIGSYSCRALSVPDLWHRMIAIERSVFG